MSVNEYDKVCQQVLLNNVDLTPDSISTDVTRRENGIDGCEMMANNDLGKTYLATMKLGDIVIVKYWYEDGEPPFDTPKIVFRGKIEEIHPSLTKAGETAAVIAYAGSYCLKQTRVSEEYGKQSVRNPQLFYGYNIIKDMILKYVLKILNNDNLPTTGYALGSDYLYGSGDELELAYVFFPFEDCFTALQDIIRLESSLRYVNNILYGLHWMCRPDETVPALVMAPVGDHDVYSSNGYMISDVWPTRSSMSPIVVRDDMIISNFKTETPIANCVIVAGKYTMPMNDEWSELAPEDVYTVVGGGNPTVSADALVFGGNTGFQGPKVGSYAVKLATTGTNAYAYLVQHFDFVALAGMKSVPLIEFWWLCQTTSGQKMSIVLATNSGNYYERMLTDFDKQGIWNFASLGTGPFNKTPETWSVHGTPDWSDINYICFTLQGGIDPRAVFWDGFRVVGNIIDMAYDSTSIGNPTHKATDSYGYPLPYNGYGCRTITIKDTIANTDQVTMDILTGEDEETPLGQLALYELLRNRIPRTTGVISVPLNPFILQGQLQEIWACQDDAGNYTIKRDFRITEVKHMFHAKGALTQLTLTDDLTSSIPLDTTDPFTIIMRAVNPDFQSRTLGSLKASDAFDDIGTIVISRDYPT